MTELNRAEKRKYAQAISRVTNGVWGYKKSLFRVITLTTRAGDDQSVERFGKDLRKLVSWFRKRGYRLEYCGCYEITKDKNLLHWHGILRVAKGYFPITRRMLGDKWNEIHNAFAVQIEPVKKMSFLEKYIIKHMAKDYLAKGVIRNKMLVSNNWERKGIKELIQDFKYWWVNVTGDVYMRTEGWLRLKLVVRRWCECKNDEVYTRNGWFKLIGGKIISEIYERS